VSKISRKSLIGIMGGLCAGKSTVAEQFAGMGCKVIDADGIVHKLLDKPDVREKIAASFGEAVLDSAGKINHKKLADVVFTDARKLSLLNEIIHPPVLACAEELITKYNNQADVKAIVLDMPLLVEIGWAQRCDKLVFVECEQQLRAKRAEKRGNFNENQLKIRENFQISLDKKAEIADYIISNNSDISVLNKQVACVFSRITANG
jgi:dephospho-CoA kinase